MNQITIYGVSAFDINSAELVDVLKINNNGEICDDETDILISFQISVLVFIEKHCLMKLQK